MPAAVAGRAWDLGHVGGWKRIVTPFPAAVVRAVMSGTVHRYASPGPRSQDDGEDDIVTDASAVMGFGGGEAVRVVLDADLAVKGFDQILLDRPSEQPCGAGAFAEPAPGLQGSRYADANAAPAPDLQLHLVDHVFDDGDAAEIIMARRRLADARQFGPVRLHRDAFDFRAAPIDPDQHSLSPTAIAPGNATPSAGWSFVRPSFRDRFSWTQRKRFRGDAEPERERGIRPALCPASDDSAPLLPFPELGQRVGGRGDESCSQR